MHEVAMSMNRNERRLWKAASERALRTGKWPAWERLDLPNGVPNAEGWTRDVRWVYRSKPLWAVLVRPFQAQLDGAPADMLHLVISNSLNTTAVTWAHKQRIKDDVVGPDRLAVEVMPPVADLVDAAPAFHLWVYPAGYKLPFGLKSA